MKKRIILLLLSSFFLIWGSVLLSFFSHSPKEFIDQIISSISSEKKPDPSVEFIFWWDIMLARGIDFWAKKEGYDRIFAGDNYNPFHQFPCYLSGECILFANLESQFSKKANEKVENTFLFRANTGSIRTLLDIQGGNQLLLSLANNHTSNAGWEGVRTTRATLDQHGIWFFGAGNSTGDAQNRYSIEKNWLKLCLQAYSYDGNTNIYGGERLSWNPNNLALMTWDLMEMQDQGCDVKILSIHRGAEYHQNPNQAQIKLAHALVDAGADIIVGNHSHIPWKFEIYQGKPIFYSLGNLLFDQDRGMRAKDAGYDYIWDYELKKRTVPTYIPLLAGVKITKNLTWITISQPELKMSRVKKGIFYPIDDETFSGVLHQIAPSEYRGSWENNLQVSI